MSDTTTIEWATHSWSPWEGCTQVSAGCANCYAATRNHRFGLDNWGKGKPRRRTSAAYWKQPLRWERAMQAAQGSAVLQRPRVFPSLCDWLDDEVPITDFADFFRLIHDTPNLDWLLLTKRPENFVARMQSVIGLSCVTGCEAQDPHGIAGWLANRWVNGVPPTNVWLGASVENQWCADERIPQILRIPAKVRFLSVEPLLEAVNLHLAQRDADQIHERHHLLHWVIVGGESGPGARPCHVDWVRSIVGQCQAASVPCFVKQLGSVINMAQPGSHGTGFMPGKLKHPKGGDPAEWPADLRTVRQFPQ